MMHNYDLVSALYACMKKLIKHASFSSCKSYTIYNLTLKDCSIIVATWIGLGGRSFATNEVCKLQHNCLSKLNIVYKISFFSNKPQKCYIKEFLDQIP